MKPDPTIAAVKARVDAADLAAYFRCRVWGTVSGAVFAAASYAWATGIWGPAALFSAALAGAWMIACGWYWWKDHKVLLAFCASLWAAVIGWLLPSGAMPSIMAAVDRTVATITAPSPEVAPPPTRPQTSTGGRSTGTRSTPSPEAMRQVW